MREKFQSPKIRIFVFSAAALIVLVFVSGFGIIKENAIEAFLANNRFVEKIKKISINLTEVKAQTQDTGIVKGIYLTSWSASSQVKINYALNLSKTAGINAVVIDIKDYSGYVAYKVDESIAPKAKKYGAEKIKIPDIDFLIGKLHAQGIYVIARISVFQDPVLANARPDLAVYRKKDLSENIFLSMLSSISIWLDNLKLAWVDPASEEVWDYDISIAKDALSRGFDEINFDYVRFPSDGDLKNMGFPIWSGSIAKHSVIKEFFKEARQEMPDAVLSVDLFGLTTVNYDDLGVGQKIEDAFEYFDYICPMVYPSHYANGFIGFANPAQHPYEVISYSMKSAYERLKIYRESNNQRLVHLRPWLQDFNMGAKYNVEMVKSEIQAVKDSLGDDYKGFMLWNPSNIYTSGALSD